MKVRDLIAKLQEMDPELPVTAFHPRHGYSEDYAERCVYEDFTTYEAKLGLDDKLDVVTEKRNGLHVRIG